MCGFRWLYYFFSKIKYLQYNKIVIKYVYCKVYYIFEIYKLFIYLFIFDPSKKNFCSATDIMYNMSERKYFISKAKYHVISIEQGNFSTFHQLEKPHKYTWQVGTDEDTSRTPH